jgi:hypothetical protein
MKYESDGGPGIAAIMTFPQRRSKRVTASARIRGVLIISASGTAKPNALASARHLCQAFGIPSSMKYESDGGPGIAAIMTFLLGSSEASDSYFIDDGMPNA